ncbi:MAG: T9SS type A sorting domain-containing protein [Bacteroidales bacterium]
MFWNAATDDQYGGMTNMGYLRLNGLDHTSVPSVKNSIVDAYYNGTKDALIISGYVGEVKVFDVLGNLVLKTRVIDTNPENINLNSVVKGVYIVSGTGFSTKFIK